MKHVLLDTHVWAWSLTANPRLPPYAMNVVRNAQTVCISAISLFEIGQKIRLGKWPEMQPFQNQLVALAEEQGAHLLELSADMCLLAATLQWDHRDPFDRLIGASAIVRGLNLVSADTAFDGLSDQPGWVSRIWER